MSAGSGDRESRELHLRVSCDTANLAHARKAIEALCQQCGFDEASWAELGLVVNEAMANIIRHAYKGDKNKWMNLDARFDQQAVHIWLRDWGSGVNPQEAPKPRRDLLQPGGIGLVCMRQLMDTVEFCPQEDGMLLKMSRRLDHHPGGCGPKENVEREG